MKVSCVSAPHRLPAATLKTIEENTARYNELRKTHADLPDIEEMRAQLGSKLSRSDTINMDQFYLMPEDGSMLIDFQYQGLIPFLIAGLPGYDAVVMCSVDDGSGTGSLDTTLTLPPVSARRGACR